VGDRRRILALLGAFVALALVLVPASAQARDYIVGYDASAGNAKTETADREDDVGFDADYVYSKAIKGFAADLSSDQVAELQKDPDVAFVVRDRPVEASGVPSAAGETIPTGVRRIGAATTTSVSPKSDVGVAVIDTGIDLANPDLDAVDGKNCISPGSPAQDDQGHGTHVAGTIAARNSGAGVVGVAPGTKLYAVKVLDSTGSGSTSSVICGIDWVTANAAVLNIKVANLSLGGYSPSVGTCLNDPERAAICRSTTLGVNYVVAAGNEGRDLYGTSDVATPASFPEVLTVSAYGDSDGSPGGQGSSLTCTPGYSDDGAAGFSNYASRAQDMAHLVAGPGVCIRSVKNGGGTSTMSGTSMAAPHVAGVVALCLSAGGVAGPCAGQTPAQIIDRIRTTAQARATTFGFQGDPLRPISGKSYGYAVNMAGASATTGAAGEVGETSAKVSGIAYPVDGTVTARFEFGTTVGYGSASDPQTVAAGAGPTAVGVAIGALAPGTTYHYRLTVSDGSGSSYGADRTFTTQSSSPVVVIPTVPVTTPISLPALPTLPIPAKTTTKPKPGDPESSPVPPTAKPSKACTTWRSRLAKANKTLKSTRRSMAGRRATRSSRKKLAAAETAVRTAKAKVKRYC
jgi:subtilisin